MRAMNGWRRPTGHNGRRRADRRLGHQAGERDDVDHQDNEGQRPRRVDDGREHAVHAQALQHRAAAGHDQHHAYRYACQHRDAAGHPDHQ